MVAKADNEQNEKSSAVRKRMAKWKWKKKKAYIQILNRCETNWNQKRKKLKQHKANAKYNKIVQFIFR